MTKCFQLQGGFAPVTPDQGLCPWTPLGALPDPRYRLVLRTRHVVPPQPLTPSAAYALNPLKCASLHRLQAAIMLIKGLLSKYAKLTILKYLALRKERVVPICLNTV